MTFRPPLPRTKKAPGKASQPKAHPILSGKPQTQPRLQAKSPAKPCN